MHFGCWGGVCVMRYRRVRGADQRGLVRWSVVWTRGRWRHFWPRWGDCVNQHSPLGSGVKLALCEEDRGWYCFV